MFKAIKTGGRKKPQVIVLGQFEGQQLDKQSREHDIDNTALTASKRPEATGELGAIAEGFIDRPANSKAAGPDRFIIVGLGDKDSFTPHRMLNVAAAVGKRLARIKADTAQLALDAAVASAKADTGTAGRVFGEGIGILAFNRDKFRGSAADLPKREDLTLRCDDRAFANGLDFGLALAESVNVARMLSETPPNECTPAYIAAEAKKLARQTGMKCSVIPFSKMEDEQLAGHYNVGQASENEPCLVRLEYTPERSRKGAKPAVLVGKTITYDSGGLSIKPPTGMRGMKRDMDGGAGVFGAMHAIATAVKPRRKVVAYLCCAENSISDEAYRPDDIITFSNGVTVEITNTDAEGRLVLADGLARACAKEKPAYIVDMATLTGGVVVALGNTHAGMWCDDDKLREKVEAAAETTGEHVWRLPCTDEHREMMRSPVADILNSAPIRAAHAIQGAAFLSYFVDENVPWCHLDIAGVHGVEAETGPYAKQSAKGFGVRLLAELLDTH